MICSVSLLLFSKKNYYLLHWCNQQRQVCSLSFYLPPTVVGDRKKQKFANALLFLSAILRFLKYIIQNFYPASSWGGVDNVSYADISFHPWQA
jgi:hypothetical protein